MPVVIASLAGTQLFLTPQWTLLAKFDGEFAKGSQTYAGTGYAALHVVDHSA